MWSFLRNLFRGGSGRQKPDTIDTMLDALDAGAAERPLPTLVCRTCGLKYANTGTYLQGSACPRCAPNA